MISIIWTPTATLHQAREIYIGIIAFFSNPKYIMYCIKFKLVTKFHINLNK